MTAKMMDALKTAGLAKEWHKDTMHRLYIDLAKANEVYYNSDQVKMGRLALNRFERGNGKVWIDMETGEICTKNIAGNDIYGQIEELAALFLPEEENEENEADAEEEEEEEEVTEAAEPLSDQELFDLCKAAHVYYGPSDNSIRLPVETDESLLREVKRHKEEIRAALSGYCFARDVCVSPRLRKWKIQKVSNDAYVACPPRQVYKGTAREVDEWARKHKDDPLFTDDYNLRYSFCPMEE